MKPSAPAAARRRTYGPIYRPPVTMPAGPAELALTPVRLSARPRPPVIEHAAGGAPFVHERHRKLFKARAPGVERQRTVYPHRSRACARVLGAVLDMTDVAVWRAMFYGREVIEPSTAQIARRAACALRRTERALAELERAHLVTSEQLRVRNDRGEVRGLRARRSVTRKGLWACGLIGEALTRAEEAIRRAEAARRAEVAKAPPDPTIVAMVIKLATSSTPELPAAPAAAIVEAPPARPAGRTLWETMLELEHETGISDEEWLRAEAERRMRSLE